MVRFFIHHPIFAIVFSTVLSLLGILALVQLPVAQYPQISHPTIAVSTTYQGANAEVLDETVAQVIEEQVNGVEGMASMSSSSSDDGSYQLSVQFDTGKNSDIASVQTQSRVVQSEPSLPTTVQSKGVTIRKASQDMSLMFDLWSPNDSLDNNFLKNYGTLYLIDDIKRIDGVGEVESFGSSYSMRIWLQPEKMAQLGISPDEVVSAVESQNTQAASGAVGQAPSDGSEPFQYSTRIKGRLDNTEEFGQIVVASGSNGGFVRLKDIARLELGSENYTYDSRMNGHPAVGFGVKLTSDANALNTINQVKAVLQKASANFPDGMSYKIVTDNTSFVKASMKEVLKTFAEALLLVTMVVFLFLQSWRATLIPMLAVPVSLLGTFAAFEVLGFTINTLTLFAMVLAIGLVVDDAIVVIEAVEYQLDHGAQSGMEAAEKAMHEVAGPIIAIVFALASVFLPVAFFSGTMGILYRQFALTIVVSMAISGLVALSLTPALCAGILKKQTAGKNSGKGPVKIVLHIFNRGFSKFLSVYTSWVQKAVAHGHWWVFALVVMTAAAFGLYKLVPSSFIPDEDQGFYMVSVTLPDASSLDRTMKFMKEFSKKIEEQPGVNAVMSMAGMDMVGGGSKSNSGSMFVSLNSWEQRDQPGMSLNDEIGKTMKSGQAVAEGSIGAFSPSGLPGLGMLGGFALMIQDRSGGTLEQLGQAADKFVEAAKKNSAVASVTSNFSMNTPGYEYEVNRDKAQKMGVSIDDIFTALQVFQGSEQINDFNKFGRSYKVTVQADKEFRGNIDSLKYIFVKSSNDVMVPLNTLLTYKKIFAPTSISRYNGVRAVQINGTAASGYSSGQVMEALEKTAAEVLPDGYVYSWSGQSREEKISNGQAPVLFGLAFLFMFLCLAALYESWSIPLAVLLSVPTGVFGAFLFQYVRGLENSIYMQIGLVMLIGLTAKNAILIVEFAKVRMEAGMSICEAAVQAALIRLRPILMTSIAFILGCIPLAFASGAGAGARNSMGNAVVAGMLAATVLEIFVVPALFVMIETLREKYTFPGKKEKDR